MNIPASYLAMKDHDLLASVSWSLDIIILMLLAFMILIVVGILANTK